MDEVDRILRFSDAIKASGRSKSTLYEMIRRGEFPAPVKIGPKAVGFLASEVVAWQKSRPRAEPGFWPYNAKPKPEPVKVPAVDAILKPLLKPDGDPWPVYEPLKK